MTDKKPTLHDRISAIQQSEIEKTNWTRGAYRAGFKTGYIAALRDPLVLEMRDALDSIYLNSCYDCSCASTAEDALANFDQALKELGE
jgi:hypothetical protein